MQTQARSFRLADALQLCLDEINRGHFANGESLLRQLVPQTPACDVRRLLAVCRSNQGDQLGALYWMHRANELEARDDVRYQLAQLYERLGARHIAKEILKEACAAPDVSYRTVLLLAYLLDEDKEYDAEIELLERHAATAEQPLVFQVVLYHVLRSRRKGTEAARLRRRLWGMSLDDLPPAVRETRGILGRGGTVLGVAIDHMDRIALMAVALAMLDLGRLEEGRAVFEDLLRIEPPTARIERAIAHCLIDIGENDLADRAIDRYLRVAEARPEPGFLQMLAYHRKLPPDSPAFAMLEREYGRIADEDRRSGRRFAQISYAYGRALMDQGDIEGALCRFREGAAARWKEAPYRFETDMAVMTLARLAKLAGLFDRGSRARAQGPVLVVGMPRSGTTLMEQMLGSHAAVMPLGELSYIADAATRTFVGLAETLNARRNHLSEQDRDRFLDELAAVGERYLELARSVPFPEGKTLFVDKMPANFRFLPFLPLMFRDFRVIHMKRHPLETCFSNFTTHFAGSLDWAYDPEAMARYYRNYLDFIQLGEAHLGPGRMRTVRYEDLVAEPERQMRGVLEFLGLPWDPGVLEFHRSKRPVKTASRSQVYRPIYDDALLRARALGEKLDFLRAPLIARGVAL